MGRLTAVAACISVCLGVALSSRGETATRLGQDGGQAPPSIEEAWRQLPAYEVGKDRSCVLTLEAHLAQTANDPQMKRTNARRLASLLAATGTTDDARAFACRQLARVGNDDEVPAVGALLERKDRRSAQMACEALIGIRTQAARAALRQGLVAATDETAPELIQALGLVRDASSVEGVAARLKRPATARVALWALGEIGTEPAADTLATAGSGPDVLDAKLRCAERLAQAQRKQQAMGLYETLLPKSHPVRYRVAALTGLVEAGHPAAASHVIAALVSDESRLAGTAATLLPRAMARTDGAQIRERLEELPAETRARAIGVLADQDCKELLPLVTASLAAQDTKLRLAAVRALGRLGTADHVRTLVDLAASGQGETAAAAVEGLAGMTADGVDAAIGKGLQEWGTGRAVLVHIAARRQIPGLSPTLLALADSTPALREDVYAALAAVGSADACTTLLKQLGDDMDDATRKALETAVSALARDDVAPVTEAWGSAGESKAVRTSILRVLSRCGGAQGLAAVRHALAADDSDIRREAVRALSNWPDASAVEDLLKLAETNDEFASAMAVRGLMRLVDVTTALQQKLGILGTLARLPGNAAANDWAQKKRATLLKEDVSASALTHAPERSAARKRELAEKAPEGFRLAAYLDCGPDASDGAKGKPSLRVKSGAPFIWKGAHRHADLRAATIVFTGGSIRIEASGLAASKSYRLGLTWWDYDHDARVQTVSLGGKQALRAAKLPSYKAKKAPPATIEIDVPASAYAKTTMPIDIASAGGVNTVLSEIWLYESDRKPEQATVPAPPKRAANAKRILLVTGEDYKGHKWRETAPALRDELLADRRLAVDLVKDLAFLRTDELRGYDAVVMHFKNYDPELPGRAGYDNLAAFVEKGGGLVLVHFACGAFQEFKEDFVKLGGRVWNPEMRGHDPFGTFAVQVVKPDHPTMAGLSGFETTDELYTCLDGTTPVDVLATAVSKIDKKTYAMAFVLQYGTGRVFHSPLGHDVAALQNEPVAKLFRQGTAWVAGLETAGN